MTFIRAELRFKNAQFVLSLERLGISQSELSRRTNISAHLISNIVNLKYIPTINIQNILCAYLGIEPDILFDQYVSIVAKRNKNGVSNKLISDISVNKFAELTSIENTKYLISDSSIEDETDKISLKYDINSVLGTLTERESDIIKMYYGIDYEYSFIAKEIGDKYKITTERVLQIKDNAERKLSHKKRNEILRKYLG